MRVKYYSQTLALKPGEFRTPFLIEGRGPGNDVGVALFRCEHDTWVFTVLGAERAFGPSTREWMLEAAATIMPAPALAAVRAAEPLSPVIAHGHPASVRRRYDLLTRFPAGLLVMGDAMCAFNPIYGQGMSVAAEEALALRIALAAGPEALAPRFLRACAGPVAAAWELAAGSDLAFPEVEGDPTLSMRLASRYVRRVLAAAEHDGEVARRFMAVSGLVAPPTALFAPRVLGPALRPRRRRISVPPVATSAQHSVDFAQSAP